MKHTYIQPQVTVVEVELSSIMVESQNDTPNVVGTPVGGKVPTFESTTYRSNLWGDNK